MTINPNKLTPIPEYPGYHLTEYGKICYYYKKIDKWMFAKKSETAGYVLLLQNSKTIKVNEAQIATKYIKNYKFIRKSYNVLTTIPRYNPLISDGRYKEGVDAGRFGSDRIKKYKKS